VQQLDQMGYEHWLVATAKISTCDWQEPPSQTPNSLFVEHFTVAFSYVADGNHYSDRFYSSHEWEKEAEVAILYNPKNPMESCICDDESQLVPALECVLALLDGL